MIKNVTIRGDQTLLDIALQYLGGAEKVFDLIDANPSIESIMDVDYAGLTLNYEANNSKTAEFFRKNSINVATRYPVVEVEYNYRITQEGDSRITEDGDTRII